MLTIETSSWCLASHAQQHLRRVAEPNIIAIIITIVTFVIAMCLLPPARRANFPPVSPQAPHQHQWREEILEVLYISWFFSHAICIADIRIHKDHGKRYQGFLPETVGAQGGMLGDGVSVALSLHNLDWVVLIQDYKGWEINLFLRETKKWMFEADTHGDKPPRLWKKPKAFELERTGHNFIDWLFTLKKFEYR